MSAADGKSLVVVGSSLNHGTVLRTCSAISSGAVIFVEAPLLDVPQSIDGDLAHRYESWSGLPAMVWNQYFCFLLLKEAAKRSVLDLFGPRDCSYAAKVRATLSQFLAGFSPRNRISTDPADLRTASDLDLEDMVALTVIFHYNSVSTPGGCALFKYACRLTHSCASNCVWSTDEQGRRVVRSRCDIGAGEELSIDYRSETLLFEPPSQRRRHLQEHYDFVCCCSLCDIDAPTEARMLVLVACRRAEVCLRLGRQSPADNVACLVLLRDTLLPMLHIGAPAGSRRSSRRLASLFEALGDNYLLLDAEAGAGAGAGGSLAPCSFQLARDERLRLGQE